MSSLHLQRWLKRFCQRIRDSVTIKAELGLVGFHIETKRRRRGTFVGITAFVCPYETVGGQFDGGVSDAIFSVDLVKIVNLFSDIKSADVRSASWYNDPFDKPLLDIVGLSSSKTVRLRFLSDPPEDEPPAFRLYTATGELR